jgi:RHS repeat-associated protein
VEFVYNGLAKPVRVMNDNQHTTQVRYDTANRRSQEIDAKGNQTRLEYDANGNLVRTIAQERSDLGGADQEFITRYEFDALNRIVKNTDSAGNVRHFQHDSRGNLGVEVDGRGNRTLYTYDGLNRLTTTTRSLTAGGTGSGTPIGEVVTWQTWDDSSRLTAQADDHGNMTIYVYDPLSRRVRTVFADGTAEVVDYNAHGNSVGLTDANGTRVISTYDALNRVIRKDITPGPGVAATTTFERFAYDGLTRLVRAENDIAVVVRKYDSLSHLTAETLNGETTACAFDGAGNAVSCTYPGGLVVTTTYDELERKQGIFDPSGEVAAYRYAGPKRVVRREFGNQTRTDYQYDGLSGVPNPPGDFGARRLVRVTHSHAPTGTVLDDRHFTWDASGNKTGRTDGPGSPTGIAREHAYDSLNRLVQTVQTVGGGSPETIRYSLDGVGNRVNVTGGAEAGNYQLSAATPEPADFQVNQYTVTPKGARVYDANGNLIRQQATAGQQQFEYDYRNRLVRFTGAAGLEAEYQYDALGRRVARMVNQSVTRYFYDGWRVCEEQDASGQTRAAYIYGNYIDEVLAMWRDGQRHFYHADDLFSVVKLTDDRGRVVEHYEYDDYGRPLVFDGAGNPIPSGVSPVGNPYLFTGRHFDGETGFYYFRTRYFDPSTGRFISRDTVGIWTDTFNLGNGYTYLANNPWAATDPMGELHPCLAAGLGGGVLGCAGSVLIKWFGSWNEEPCRKPTGADYLQDCVCGGLGGAAAAATGCFLGPMMGGFDAGCLAGAVNTGITEVCNLIANKMRGKPSPPFVPGGVVKLVLNSLAGCLSGSLSDVGKEGGGAMLGFVTDLVGGVIDQVREKFQ